MDVKDVIISIVLAVLAWMRPLEGELWSLVIVFGLNFLFGYLNGMIAKGEEFSLKKALVCVGHATVFFILCLAIFGIGKLKGEERAAMQCVSFFTYLILYFYGLNILRNIKGILKRGSAPWHVVSALYWLLRFEFVKKIPWLAEYLASSTGEERGSGGTAAHTT